MTAEAALKRHRGGQPGEDNGNWRGGAQHGICAQCGSVFTGPKWLLKKKKFCSHKCYTDHNKKPLSRNARKHVRIVEKILGRRLPESAVVHHINRNRKDNRPSNFVICQDQAYHMLLHARTRIVEAGGNPTTDKICARCRQLKPKTDFHKRKTGDGFRFYCKECQSEINHKGRLNHG